MGVNDTGGNPAFTYTEIESPYDDSTAIKTSVVGNTYSMCPSQYIEKTFNLSGNTDETKLKAYLEFTSTMDYYNFPYVVVYLFDNDNYQLGHQIYYGKGVISGIYANYASNNPASYTELSASSGDMILDLSKMGSDIEFNKIKIVLANYACIGQNSIIFDHLRVINGSFDNGTGTTLTATDNCPGVQVEASIPSGSFFPVGTTPVTLTATDAAGNTTTCTFTVTVEDNEAPVVVCQNLDFLLNENGQVTITAEEIDGGSTDNCGIESMELDRYTFDLDDAGENEVTLTVTDIYGNSASCIATIQIINQPPEIITTVLIFADEGETVKLDASESYDPEGQDITFFWSAIDESQASLIVFDDPTSPTPSFVAPEVGEFTVIKLLLRVNDGANTTSEIIELRINDVPDKKPVADAGTDFDVDEGTTGFLDGTGSFDPEGETITFLWTTDLELDDPSSATPSFVAPLFNKDTTVMAVLVVNDGVFDSEPDTVRITIKDVNHAPVANAGYDVTVYEGEEFTLDGSASDDPDGDEISFLWASDYFTIDDPTLETIALLAPDVPMNMTIPVKLTVSDGELDSQPDTVWVTIIKLNNAPVAHAGDDVTVNEGETFTLDGSGSNDPDGDEISFLWSTGSLMVEENSLPVITATAPEVEKDTTFPVILVVNDGELNSQPDTVYVTVLQVNKAPSFDEIEHVTADIGYGFSVTVSASDPDALDELIIFADDLPDWLVLTDNGDGTAVLHTDSIPRLESLLGEHSFTIQVTDGTETVETQFNLTVSIKTGLTDLTLSSLKLYPNPTSDFVNIRFDSLPEKETKIQVYNQLGQSILIMQARETVTRVNLSPNPAGLYYIKITSNGFSKTEKIILR
ncbi:MAG TPA: T9SS type A sorting domain-containing protein [Mariniphaga anaerophila]|uniref:T9SS type A sorting domain-containing protein n=1 Tax=Mariniphaga anaerophila TaxID=1484053 RepID=A0A831LFW4_9BACT|nr:T9SS type A sorting domain-containing protein [Mariniphaga anaerophila]